MYTKLTPTSWMEVDASERLINRAKAFVLFISIFFKCRAHAIGHLLPPTSTGTVYYQVHIGEGYKYKTTCITLATLFTLMNKIVLS